MEPVLKSPAPQHARRPAAREAPERLLCSELHRLGYRFRSGWAERMKPAASTVVRPLPGMPCRPKTRLLFRPAERRVVAEDAVAGEVADNAAQVVVDLVVQGLERRPPALAAGGVVGLLRGAPQLVHLTDAQGREGLRGHLDDLAQLDDGAQHLALVVLGQGELVAGAPWSQTSMNSAPERSGNGRYGPSVVVLEVGDAERRAAMAGGRASGDIANCFLPTPDA